MFELELWHYFVKLYFYGVQAHAMWLTQKVGLEGEVTKLDPAGPLDFYS